jgi:hypothetical protein
MIPADLAEQVRSEVKRFKEVQDQFLQTYQRLCAHHGGARWKDDKDVHVTFYHVRGEIIPMMEQAGMDARAVQALCAWAETTVLHR